MLNVVAVYAIAHASKAVIPRDSGGPFGQRIGVSDGGNQNLVVSAFVTKRTSSSGWWRYSLVVLNQCVPYARAAAFIRDEPMLCYRDDKNNGSWDPVDIAATIEFRGKQV